MGKIYNIISSELVARTNNIKFKQEYGEVGKDANITEEGTSTVFSTRYSIARVVYVTVNGLNLIEGVHYIIDTKYRIKISNSGSAIKNNPGLTSTILVGYQYVNRKSISEETVKIPPVITTFYLNTYSGKDGKILFDFVINPVDGKNIYWSILKDGEKTPLFSGSALSTNNSNVPNDSGGSTELSYYVSVAEYEERQGQDISFTFVVIYDLSEDGSRLDEKLIESAKYNLVVILPITGSVITTPETITTTTPTDMVVSYSIDNPSGTSNVFEWRLIRTDDNNTDTIVKQGNQQSGDLSGTYIEQVNGLEGASFDIRYRMDILEIGDSVFKTISNDVTRVRIPAATKDAYAGYLDSAIMNYQDPADGVWKRIGDLGTSQDLVEYNARVPIEIFTKDVLQGTIDSGQFISAPVNDFSGTVSSVYFVIEIPDTWGPIEFYQALGKVDISAFNIIDLQTGYSAYLYKDAPSAVSTPADFHLKSF